MNYAALSDIRRYAPGLVKAEDIRVLGELESCSAIINGVLARRYSLPLLTASSGGVVFGGAPADGDTILIGDRIYRFKDTLALIYDVKRTAGDAAACAAALTSAINLDPLYVSTRYYTGTLINGYFAAALATATITLTARAGGVDGNSIPVSSASSAITEAAPTGGAGSYSVLRMICVDLVQAVMMRGQAVAAIETGTERQASDLWKNALARLEYLVDEGALYDDTGATPGAATGAMPSTTVSGYTPEVGTSDPEHWGWDPDRAEAAGV